MIISKGCLVCNTWLKHGWCWCLGREFVTLKGSDSSKLLTLRCMSLRILFLILSYRNTPARRAYVQKAALCCHWLRWQAFGCDVKGFIQNDDPAVCVSVCAWWYDRRLCWQSVVLATTTGWVCVDSPQLHPVSKTRRICFDFIILYNDRCTFRDRISAK